MMLRQDTFYLRSLVSEMMNRIAFGLLLTWFGVAGSTVCAAQESAAPADGPSKQFEITIPAASNDYPLTEDSKAHAPAPKGSTFQFTLRDSTVFPGTSQTITVYVPAAYTVDQPACTYVQLDGLDFHVSTVFDNLISQHAMPVTIAIGVSSGTVESSDPQDDPRFQRSFEFDSLTDRLATFLLEDVLPAVENHTSTDGRRIHLSTDPNDRAIGGGSTGGIGAFTVAWQKPDAFRRVFSAIGTFVGMRGGEQYYVQVRKSEPKPIRIFMQDGVHDEWPGGPEMGDWWMSNLTMQRALEFAGYDVRHVWGLGTHDGHQADAVFPEAMRWLWRDWPAPIMTQNPGNPTLKDILEVDESWHVVMDGCHEPVYLAADASGKVYFPSHTREGISQIPGKAGTTACTSANDAGAMAFGPDSRTYIVDSDRGGGITAYDQAGKRADLIRHVDIKDIFVRNNGDVYASARGAGGIGDLWLIRHNGEKLKVAEGIKGSSGITVSPDGLWMFIAQRNSRRSYSYRINPDGTLDHGEPFYEAYVPASADDSGAASVVMDRDGRAYLATRMGIQVFDHNGRVVAILPLPGNHQATGLCFGGEGFSTLFVSSGDKVYARKLKVSGLPPGAPAMKVPNWGAG
jgi:gluconolactonase